MWQDLANTLQTGEKRKFSHCGGTPAASVWKSQFGIGFKCYRCTLDGYEKFGVRSVAEVLAARSAFDRIDERSTKIPVGSIALHSDVVPSVARQWVLKAGLSPEEAALKYGMLWHEETRRVFIPTGAGAMIARAVYKEDQPKYKLFGRLGTGLYILPGNAPVVVVEDILSAIKVHKAGYKSCAILGTSIAPVDAMQLAENPDIVLWLDPDKAGIKGRSAVKRALGLYPTCVRYAKTTSTKDPKFLTREEITQTVEATMQNGS